MGLGNGNAIANITELKNRQVFLPHSVYSLTQSLFCYAVGQILFPRLQCFKWVVSHLSVFICLRIQIAAAPQFLPMFLLMLFPIWILVFHLNGFFISSMSANFFVTMSSFILKTTPYTPSHCTNNKKFHLQRSLCWPDTQIRIIFSIDIP